jgi:nucleotide-binding universal stress UspA family protein
MSDVIVHMAIFLYLARLKSGVMKNILVPTDFSNNAYKALTYAGGLATHSGATVHILHAYTLLENVVSGLGGLRESWNEARKKEKTAALLQAKQDILERFPALKVEVHLFTGSTEEVLLKNCEEGNIDLVVMGKQGTAGIESVFMGSVTANLIGKSSVPVLAIPEHYELKEPFSMVLATRGFERSQMLTDPVFELAALFDLSVQVLVFADQDQVEAGILRSAAQLEDYVAWLKQHYPLARISGYLAEGDDFETSLREYCEQNEIGILCMLTYHRSFWDSLFNPSLTRKMAFHTKIPLLAVPM